MLGALGFGGGPIGWCSGPGSERRVIETLDAAWDGGVRYFDTAPFYGHGASERRIGS